MKNTLSLFLFLLVLQPVQANRYLALTESVAQVSISNDDLSINFGNSGSFQLLSLSDNKGKIWTVSPSGALWRLVVMQQGGSKVTLTPQNTQYQGVKAVEEPDRKSLVFSWLYPLGGDSSGKIIMTVSVTNKNTLSEWDIRSEFPSGWYVDDLTFPLITLQKTPQSKMILPMGWGVEFDLMSRTSGTFNCRYPNSAGTVQLMLMHENNNVFYFATHDSNANIKTFMAKIATSTLELSNVIEPSSTWNDNGRFSLPWSVSIGLSNKGWEEAITKWYRPFSFETTWGEKKITEKQYPEWFLNSDLWLTGANASTAELQRTQKAMTYFGTQTSFHWYYWPQAPFDTQYPEYFPAKDGFEDIVEQVQAAGSHVMPYINGRLWDTTIPSYITEGGKTATVLNKDLTPFTSTFNNVVSAVICPSTLVWKQKMIELTQRIQGDEVGASSIYFDQIAAARGVPCYNPEHNHPPGGGDFWVNSFRDIFQSVRATLKPNSIIATEQNAEPYMDMFDLFLMAASPQQNGEPVPLFPIIYSDRAILYGFKIANNANLSYRIQNTLALLWGAQLNGGRTEFVQYTSMVSNAAFLKDLVNFRKQHHDVFVGGTLLKEITPEGDNPMLTVPDWPVASSTGTSSAVRGALWKSPTGQYAVVLVNVDEQPHTVALFSGGNMLSIGGGKCVRIDIDETQIHNFI
ncbi:hypothetical protein G5B00_08725 [Parapedobacter sp. SGR-10]|uniref:DUF6259 domain-containing protein n=1 Tax=Parapedobacter sp. SGR-10 TaxID=2710879 RepID=UPI0013D3640F|nr:DUF6259 domain-containing protein [Parapedobacter sp. SGR-10]NGF56600.1 hypothetical protein [Parapedobacter sp. SGR-10]